MAPAAAFAGDACSANEDLYVKQLEQVARGKTKMEKTDVYCLGFNFLLTMGSRWAGSRTARVFASSRKSNLRGRIGRACQQILTRGRFEPSRTCVRLLADYGIAKVGKHETFLLQKKYYPHGMPPYHLAALNDRRATPQLIARFPTTRVCSLHHGGKRCIDLSARARKRAPWRRKAYRAHKFNVLNALWHLADPAAESFLKQTAAKDPDKRVRKLAGLALARLKKKAKK